MCVCCTIDHLHGWTCILTIEMFLKNYKNEKKKTLYPYFKLSSKFFILLMKAYSFSFPKKKKKNVFF